MEVTCGSSRRQWWADASVNDGLFVQRADDETFIGFVRGDREARVANAILAFFFCGTTTSMILLDRSFFCVERVKKQRSAKQAGGIGPRSARRSGASAMAKRRKQQHHPAGSGALTAESAQVAGSGQVAVGLAGARGAPQAILKAGEDWALLDAIDLCAGAARRRHCGLSMLFVSAMCNGVCLG